MLMLSTVLAAGFLEQVNPGVYQEEIGKVAILNNDAEVWVRIDLETLEKDIEVVEDLAGDLLTVCRNSTMQTRNFKADCLHQMIMIETMVENLKLDYKNLFARRPKRAIEWLGAGIKILFGTLDLLDRKSIHDKLANLRLKQNNFEFESSKLIDLIVSQYNDTQEILKHQSEMMERLNTEIKILNHKIDYDSEIRSSFFFSNLVTQLIALYSSTDNRIRDIHQSMVDLQNNILNTKIITLDHIIDALKSLKVQDETIAFSIDTENPQFEVMRKLMKCVVLLQDKNLIVIFAIPLREDSLGTVRKFYSIPTIDEEIVKFLDITDNYIITDKTVNRYVSWDKYTFDKNCIKIEKIFYCSKLDVMSKEQTTCVYKILLGFLNDIDKTCGIKMLKTEKTILMKTENDNKYIAITTRKNYGSLILDGNTELLAFDNTQILSVKGKGTLRLGHLEVKFHGENERIQTQITIQKNWNLTLDNTFNVEPINVPTIEVNSVLKTNDINIIAEKSEKLKRLAEKDKLENFKLMSFAVTFVIILAIIVIAGTTVLYLFKRRLNNMVVSRGRLLRTTSLPLTSRGREVS